MTVQLELALSDNTRENFLYKVKLENDLIDKYDALSKIHRDNKAKLFRDFRKICKHKDITKKTYYDSGDYYSTAYTRTWYVCDYCLAESEKKTETHSYYG